MGVWAHIYQDIFHFLKTPHFLKNTQIALDPSTMDKCQKISIIRPDICLNMFLCPNLTKKPFKTEVFQLVARNCPHA